MTLTREGAITRESLITITQNREILITIILTREGAIIRESLFTITLNREIPITTTLVTTLTPEGPITLTRGSQAPSLNASPLRLTMKSRLINRGGTQRQISLTSLDRFIVRNHHVTGEGAP